MIRARDIRRSSGGFTLLEVLMVVLVVGILSAMVMFGLNSGGPERHLNDEAERLASLLSLAGNEAVMQNREYGLQLEDERGYRFLCMDPVTQRWSPCVEDGLFKAHALPEGLEIRVVTASRVQLPDAQASSKKAADSASAAEQPDMLMLSSGEASPGELEIRVIDDPSQRIPITLDEIGRVRWGEQTDKDDSHAG